MAIVAESVSEAHLKRQVADLRAIVATQQSLVTATSAEQVMAIVTSRCLALTGATGAVVELLDGDEMVYRAAAGSASGHVGLRLAAATSLSGRAVDEARLMRCDDAETDPRVDLEACRRVGARSMLCVPLVSGDQRCLGVLKVMSAEANTFGQADEPVLETLAGFVADCLHHARRAEDNVHRATHDHLTGLPNRALILDRVTVALARAARSGRPVTLLFVDLDRFKAVNDELGHAAGDQILVVTAERLRSGVRRVDTVGRLGGDEFVVVCEDLGDDELDAVVDRLRRCLARPIPLGGSVVHLGASIGTTRDDPADDAEALVARADRAMYLDKAARR